MNWTNKQSVALAGAIGIQVAVVLLLSDHWRYSPGISGDSAVMHIVHARLIDQSESVPAQSTRHTAVRDLKDVRESSVVAPPSIDTDAREADASLGLSFSTLREMTDYVPVSELTERPVVLANIDSELSARFAFIHPQSLTLILLINEYGDVDRVLVSERKAVAEGREENALPAVLLDDLVLRFLDMRFLPGRLNGQAVRSALRIRASLGP